MSGGKFGIPRVSTLKQYLAVMLKFGKLSAFPGEVSMKMRALFSIAVLFVATITAEPQTWTGQISDSQCRAKHEQGEGVEPMTDEACTKACLKGGSKYVFVSGDKVYEIANQNNPELATHAGQTVKVSGEMKGDSITVSKIEKTAGE